MPIRAALYLLLLSTLSACSSVAHKVVLAPTPAGQSKTIAVFFDGTHNDEASDTNVKRLHALVTLRRTTTPMAALYVEGVGTSADVVGMGTGAGIKSRVITAYEFLRAHHQPGDRIVLVGFSRGAFSARILASLLYNAGLPQHTPAPGEARLSSADIADAVYGAVKRDLPLQDGPEMRALWAEFERTAPPLCPQTMAAVQSASSEPAGQAWALRRAMTHCSLEQQRIEQRTPVQVEVMALWDTVEALGIPDYGARVKELLKVAPMPINIDVPNPLYGDQLCNVQHAYQALALDDNRERIFTPLPLSRRHLFADCPQQEPLLGPQARSPITQEARLQEVWFSSAHSDVGGGYADTALPGVSLNWMLDRLKPHGLVAADAAVVEDRFGLSHDPEAGVWRPLYRAQNRNVAAYALSPQQLPGGPALLCVHPSVFERRRLLAPQPHEYQLLALREPGEVCLTNSPDPWDAQRQRLTQSDSPPCAANQSLQVAAWPHCTATH